MRNAFLVLLLLWGGLPLSGKQAAPSPTAPKKAKTRVADRAPLNFSGVWELDPKMSSGGSWRMGDAVLSVKQHGNVIYIEPIESKAPKLLAEEIIADGRPYEKVLGAGKSVVTAQWAKDGKYLFIEVTAGPPENPREAVQRSYWKLSSDRSVWVRESVSVSKGTGGRSRLVFRKRGPAKTPTATPRS